MAALQATRETFWTIGSTGKLVFHALAAVTILAFLYGVAARVARYKYAREASLDRFDNPVTRVSDAIRSAISNKNLFDRDLYAGAVHALTVWGFLTLLIATTVLGIDIDLYRPITGESFWTGEFYLVYQFAVDAFGLLFVVGLGMALVRRYRTRESRLWSRHNSLADDALVWSLFCLGIGGFAMEAISMVGEPGRSSETVSFVGYTVAAGLAALGLTPELAAQIYTPLWWSHALLAFLFIAWIPHAKPFHMLSAFATLVTRDSAAGSRLPTVPGDVDHTHAETMDDFTWRQLLEQDACTNCGHCTTVCPAHVAGRPLDPRDVILDLKSYRRTVGESLPNDRSPDQREPASDGGTVPIVSSDGGVIDADAVTSCVSCLACVEACPAGVEHPTTLTRLSRQLVETGAVDGTLQDVFQHLVSEGNSFGEPAGTRADWADDLPFEITDAREMSVEYLWYVGDYPSFDPRNARVAQALAMLFTRAGVDFGILYDDERYDGNDIRRVGEEFLFLELAGHHVDSFTACDFEKIVCTDPHSYNTFANEYSEIDFGEYADDPVLSFEHDHHWNRDGATEIFHWTEVVADLVESGRLDLSDADLDYTVTYHDPCHLGRYNDIYDPPRRLIEATGAELVEMPRNRADAFCCGGGGGGVWLDVSDDPAPSVERLREATHDTTNHLTENPPEKFVVACPQCTSMFEHGRKTGGFEAALDIVDLSELLLEATGDLPLDESLTPAAGETKPSD